MDFVRYWNYYQPGWPLLLYPVFAILFLLFLWKKQGRWIVLVIYVNYIYAITLGNRTPFERKHFQYAFFWSFHKIMTGSRIYLEESLLNLAMLLPIGFLIPYCAAGIRRTIKFRYVVLIGFLMTFAIETGQLLTKRGVFEFGDILLNTIGCMIGYVTWRLFEQIRKWLVNKR